MGSASEVVRDGLRLLHRDEEVRRGELIDGEKFFAGWRARLEAAGSTASRRSGPNRNLDERRQGR